jgi:negative regulator of sigma E activity
MTRSPFLIATAALALILLAASLGGIPAGPSSARAQEMLAAAWSDAERIPYLAQGETAVEVQGRWLRSRIRVSADDRRERYEYTTGPATGAVVCCDGDQRWHCTRGGSVAAHAVGTDAIPAARPQIDRIARNYRFALTGRSRVAGRRAHVVTLIARDTNRRVRRLWVDAERWVILAMTQYDARGRPAAWTRYSEIEFRPGLEVSFPTPVPQADDGETARPTAEAGTDLSFRPATPRYLPAGYQAVGPPAIVDCPCGCSGVTEVRRYSDGVRSFSLFQTDLSRHRCDLDGACRRGHECGHGCRATSYGSETVVSRRVGPVTAVAVGDLSLGQLRRVVESL